MTAKAAVSYFSRRLRAEYGHQTWEADDADVLAIAGPKVVLGEPGMGKSSLLRDFGQKLDVQLFTAVRFMLARNPSKLVVPGKPLLIDGLDEAMARRGGDAVDMILAQLEDAGSPEFILSCRSREWQARSMTNLRQLYGANPIILTLKPFSRPEARAFLVARHASVDADHVLQHLEQHKIVDLYRNPLTLGLMGRVAEHDQELPATRASLYERVCTLIWPEHDSDRQDTGLGAITEEQALSSAGAIAASLLLAGAEAANLAGPGQLQQGDLRLPELAGLPGAEQVPAIFSSKLFQSVGIGRAQPVHRVIAEYLGARWLAKWSSTPRTQRRLLAQLQGSGGVPASLRGLHAWLAHHSTAMAKRVIAADPFGVLRYGDSATLNSNEAGALLDALHALAKVDPYFRAQDWDSHAAQGLFVPHLRSQIEATIASADSNGHLRSLLIEGLKGAELARELAGTLELVMHSTAHFYRERMAAAEALLLLRNRQWWQCAIDELRAQGTEDSTRLARYMIEQIGCDVADDLLVATLFAEMGVTTCPLPYRDERRTRMVRHYRRIVESLPPARLAGVLDLVASYAVLVGKGDWESANDVAEITLLLLIRTIDEKAIGLGDAARLWTWLGVLEQDTNYHRGETNALQERLNRMADLRHAVQEHALYAARPQPTIWVAEFDLARRMIGLAGRPEDISWFLNRMAHADNKDAALREDWRDLMRLAVNQIGFDPQLMATSRKFQRGDTGLAAFIKELRKPKKPAWERRLKQNAATREKKRQSAFETARRTYAASRTSLRAGELRSILKPAKAYLGLFQDLKRDQPARGRLAEWLGDALIDDTMDGFEAVLHRADLPSSIDIADGIASGKTWNYGYGIMAGLLARHLAGKGFAAVPHGVLISGLLLCYNDRGSGVDQSDWAAIQETLEAIVIPTAKDREDFARLWIEPSLASGCAHVSGLYKLARDDAWQTTGAALAPGWLTTFTGVPERIEAELVDCLTHAGVLSPLIPIAASRAAMTFHSHDHQRAWLAINLLVRFEVVAPTVSGIGARDPEFIWFLRNRFQLERHGAMVPVSTVQAQWIVSEFRAQWPYAVPEGSGSGDTNPYDASYFLRALIARIANDTSSDGSDIMAALVAEPEDSYSELIRHMATEQHQKRAEEKFAPLRPEDLRRLLTEGAPANADDLKALVLEEIAVAQKVLIGDDLDQIRDFWGDNGIPYDENRCRDRLAAMIGPELMRYDVQRVTEADMPNTKRADLAFTCGAMQLPMEVKGQWHSQVWDAATDQLDLKYLIDWRSDQRGIYCVLWFGDLPASSGRRLKAPPTGMQAPATAEEMRNELIARIPEARRSLIDVVVLDLTSGKP